MSEPWGQPPPPVEHHHHHHEDDDGILEELFDDDGHRGHASHRPQHASLLRDQVRTRYGRGIAVGDLLAWLDYRVNELHAALLEGERHPSRVPGSPVRMSGLDAVLNTDATAFRTLTELSARMDRIEEKLDRLLER
ncbi:hypothetical protein ACQPX6_04375 [Actinomycetospora sp. CA-101289]|uniref:hypothetical protein n=1 Tax=Actinomycetospora sp. CA-101289 TaxID=3239893 RepID=UPI003D986CAC